MIKYLMLVKGSFAKWNSFSEDKRQDIIIQFGNFAKELHKLGFMCDGDGCNERSFRFFNRDTAIDHALIDINSNDMVTGYFIIEVPNETEALRVLRLCPAFDCDEYVELVRCGH